ncbi:MAG: response regulator transcription factor [Armatimonadota bacterium]|nr:response regulator transcription factor [Armatimonadota bacterium]
MPRVLILGDDERAVNALASDFVGANYIVGASAIEAEAAEETMSKGLPDIIVADLRPLQTDPAGLKSLIGSNGDFAVIPLVALIQEARLQALSALPPVDDIVVEPVRATELLARVRMVLMRRHKLEEENIVRLDGLIVDLENYEVTLDGEPLDLTYKEYELLRFLITRRGRVFTREALLNHVWGYDYFGGARTVDVHIRRIRAKLGVSYESYIETVRNVGYRFGSG